MDDPKPSFLPYDFPAVTEEQMLKRENKLIVNDDTRTKLEQMKSILREETNFHFPDDDAFLLQFLRTRKMDAERAATLCRNFFRTLHECKHLYDDVDFPSLLRKVARDECIGILPVRDPDGSVVIVNICERWIPKNLSAKEHFQLIVFTIIQCMRSPMTQVSGMKFITDFRGYTLHQLTHLSPTSTWYAINSAQSCIPCPMKGFQAVNENELFSYLWSLVKMVMKKKLLDRCHFLGKNMKKLQAFYPAEILPEELGGSAGPFSSEAWLEFMKDFNEYFQYLKQYGYDKEMLR